MKYQFINKDEKLTDTINFLDIKWNSQSNIQRNSKKNLNVSECKIYMRGQVWIVEHDEIVLYYETHIKNYPYFEMAFHYMDVETYRKWKTVNELATFRQAIRESFAQGTNYFEVFITEPITEKKYRKFLKFARAHDLVHHGDNTF